MKQTYIEHQTVQTVFQWEGADTTTIIGVASYGARALLSFQKQTFSAQKQ